MFVDYLRTSGHKTPFFYLSRFSPGMLLLCRRLSFISISPSLNVTLLFHFTFNIDELPLVFPSRFDLCYSFPSVDNIRFFNREYIVERDYVSDQEIALVSSKSNIPEKIEVALTKKGEAKAKPWALLEGSLSSRSLCTCHPDSIPPFFSRKRTADKNPL